LRSASEREVGYVVRLGAILNHKISPSNINTDCDYFAIYIWLNDENGEDIDD